MGAYTRVKTAIQAAADAAGETLKLALGDPTGAYMVWPEEPYQLRKDQQPGYIWQPGGEVLQTIIEKICDELDTVGAPQPWWEWNGTDLSQFDSKVEGGNVTSSTVQVVTSGGLKWVDMAVTSTSAASGIKSGVILPISMTPPDDNYVIAFDFISIQTVGDDVGAGGLVRYSGLSVAYYCRYITTSTGGYIQDFGKFDTGETVTSFEDMDDPRLRGADRGVRMALSIDSESSAGVLAKLIIGEPAMYLDKSPHTSKGKAALWCTTNSNAGTVQNYFRNIKCYLASEVEQFEL